LLFIFVMPKFVQTFYHIFFQFFSFVFEFLAKWAWDICDGDSVLSWLWSNS
jgi:hypothetical protein